MKSPLRIVSLVSGFLLACAAGPNLVAADLKLAGMRLPAKISAEDGVTQLSTKIGTFATLSREESTQAILNVSSRFPQAHPWATWAVGVLPHATTFTPEANEEYLATMDQRDIAVFPEIYPRKTEDVPAMIEEWLGKLKTHRCVKGFGVDLEYYRKVDDATAQLWEEKVKSHNPEYRLFLKHWDPVFMPPVYRGAIMFVCTSSEAPIETLNDLFAKWAAHFAPNACAFQIGYPADEDGMDGSKETGWWKLKDPIKEWGNALLSKIENPKQEIGILWVCVKSGKSYHAKWDLGAAVSNQ